MHVSDKTISFFEKDHSSIRADDFLLYIKEDKFSLLLSGVSDFNLAIKIAERN